MSTTLPAGRSTIGPVEWATSTRRVPPYDGQEGKVNPEATLPRLTYACAPSRTQRYSLNRTVKYEEPCRVIEPSSILFSPDSPLPPSWEPHIHPEGLPYFVLFLPDDGQLRRIVTEEWMYDPSISALILEFIKQIQEAISICDATIWPDSDLFIELQRAQGKLVKDDDGDAHCGYYFVHSASRCIYWPEKVTLRHFTSEPVGDISGDLSGYQTQLCLEVEYWTHWNHFPALYSVTPAVGDYIIDTIMCVMTDVISASHSASTIFTYEQLHRMLKLVRIAKGRMQYFELVYRYQNIISWCFIGLIVGEGRFMMQLTRERLRNYFGAWGARLDKAQSVVNIKPEPRSMLLLILSPPLFFVPHAQLERAESLIIDQFFILCQWEEFFKQLQEEWKGTAIIAAIIVAADCAFMIMTEIHFRGQPVESYNSQLRIINYLSLTTGFSGAILGLVTCQIRWLKWASLEADKYMEESNFGSNFNHKLQHLALIWSLPRALVLWSVLTLATSLLLFSFTHPFTATKATVGICTSILSLFTFYYVIRFGNVMKFFGVWFRCIIEGFGVVIRAILKLGRKLMKFWRRMGLINLL